MNLTKTHTKTQQIINQLEADIVSGKMIPGQRLQSVRTLADSFNTSISVLNNAFNVLETRGMIRRKPRSGVFVNGASTNVLELHNHVFLCMPCSGHVYQDLFALMFEKLNRASLIPMLVDYRQLLTDKPNQVLARESSSIFNSDIRAAIIFGRNYWQNPILANYPKVNGIFMFEMDYPGSIPGNAVLVDYEAASYAMTTHLARQGRKRIMFCVAEPDQSSVSVQSRTLHHFRHICSGYERALRDCGIAQYNMLFTRACWEDINEQALADIMASSERPDAIMCHLDSSAYRFIEAATKLGIKVPDDLAITGFYNTPWTEVSPVKITTVNFNLDELTSQVMNMAMTGKAERKVVYIKPEIIVKESCGGMK